MASGCGSGTTDNQPAVFHKRPRQVTRVGHTGFGNSLIKIRKGIASPCRTPKIYTAALSYRLLVIGTPYENMLAFLFKNEGTVKLRSPIKAYLEMIIIRFDSY